jgi:transposase
VITVHEGWVEHGLGPELTPGQGGMLDNASVHQSDPIRDRIERAGCQVVFLPPYSPDLNKIETVWARIKHPVRKTSTFYPLCG